jgi:sugar phosphate isomerase/epimerase
VGQAVCDLIDERHQSILPPHVWGDGEPEGVRQRAAAELADTARAAAKFGVKTVTGFTGSSVWHSIYAFPPTTQAYWDKGFADFAQRFGPILDVFEQHDINFALEVHPTEIAFDIASAERAIAAVGGNKRFGFNYDPSHLAYQGVDYIKFIRQFADRIYNAHMKDVWWGKGDGTVGVFGGHTSFGDARRNWDFRSVGRGMIDFESIIVALNDIGYQGPLSVEWEDSRMDRVHGATESAAFCKRLDFKPAAGAFDAVFARRPSRCPFLKPITTTHREQRRLVCPVLKSSATPWWAAATARSSARCTARPWRLTASSNWWRARSHPRPSAPVHPARNWTWPTTATTALGKTCWPTSCAAPRMSASTW